MRPIDADALREHLHHEAFEEDNGMQKWDSGLWIRYKLFEQALKVATTIEAEPVRHGRWIRLNHFDWKCSECENILHLNIGWLRPEEYHHCFCSNCGAKMDLK